MTHGSFGVVRLAAARPDKKYSKHTAKSIWEGHTRGGIGVQRQGAYQPCAFSQAQLYGPLHVYVPPPALTLPSLSAPSPPFPS